MLCDKKWPGWLRTEDDLSKETQTDNTDETKQNPNPIYEHAESDSGEEKPLMVRKLRKNQAQAGADICLKRLGWNGRQVDIMRTAAAVGSSSRYQAGLCSRSWILEHPCNKDPSGCDLTWGWWRGICPAVFDKEHSSNSSRSANTKHILCDSGSNRCGSTRVCKTADGLLSEIAAVESIIYDDDSPAEVIG